MHPHRAASCVLAAMLLASPLGAFSGDGLARFREGKAHLYPETTRPPLRDELMALDPIERNQKAAELLESALYQATSPREQEELARHLGKAYNEIAVEHFKRKDYTSAIYAEEKAIEHRGDESPVMRMNLGGMYHEQGDYYNAALSYERALALSPDPETRDRIVNDLVSAYIKDGQTRDPGSYTAASRFLEDELASRPGEQSLYLMLGRVRQFDGDLPGALEAWEGARRIAPLQADLERQYEGMKAAIRTQRDFVRAESRHFVIDFDDARHGKLAEKFLEMFEDAYDDIGARFNAHWAGVERVTITVYTGEEFVDAVRIPWAGGVHRGNRIELRVGPGSADEVYRDTIRHEFTHHVIDFKAAGKRAPAWLQEGVAMLQEKSGDVGRFYRELGQAMAAGGLLPLKSLEGSFSQLPADQVRLAYGQSYDFCRYLLKRRGEPPLLQMLRSLGEGATAEDAFQSAFGASLEQAETQWRASLEARARRARDAQLRQAQQAPGGQPTYRGVEAQAAERE